MATFARKIAQGYLCRDAQCVVRVRIADDRAFLTVKGDTVKDTRPEFEYEIPLSDARAMLHLCSGTVITKTRYVVPYEGHVWEVDEFDGKLQGLVIAEIELEESTHGYMLPPFAGCEVTDNAAYYNSNLCKATEPPVENI